MTPSARSRRKVIRRLIVSFYSPVDRSIVGQADRQQAPPKRCFPARGFLKNWRGTLVVPGVPWPRYVTIVVRAIHEWPLPVNPCRTREDVARRSLPILTKLSAIERAPAKIGKLLAGCQGHGTYWRVGCHPDRLPRFHPGHWVGGLHATPTGSIPTNGRRGNRPSIGWIRRRGSRPSNTPEFHDQHPSCIRIIGGTGGPGSTRDGWAGATRETGHGPCRGYWSRVSWPR